MMIVKITKQKTQKSFRKRKLKFENYKSCLEAAQLENKIIYLEKKTDIDSIKKNYQEFAKINK